MAAKKYQHLAEIEYHGRSGITQSCLNAIMRILQYGDVINSAKLISCTTTNDKKHGFILTINERQDIVVRCGFSSGYSGEGPRGLSTALRLIQRHTTDIFEYEVKNEFVDRLDNNCLTKKDIESLREKNYIRGSHWAGYILGEDSFNDHARLNSYFPPSVPYNVIDSRIMDLAFELGSKPDAAVTSAYRRLEGIVRKRTKIQESGAKLFAKSFMDDSSPLHWNDEDRSEQKGKAQLFIGVYGGFRNPRMHREFESKPGEYLREFLLINELFVLESESVER